jgi:hypothetical protein
MSQLLASLPIVDCPGHGTDVFANGASLAAGDLNGDRLHELVLGAGPQGTGVFRVAMGRSVTTGNQPQFDSQLRANMTPYSSIMAGGRFKDYGVGLGEHPAEQASDLDLFVRHDLAGGAAVHPPSEGVGGGRTPTKA